MARACNKKSIVLFGPTDPTFLAYPQNINIFSSECGNCWWVTRDWVKQCPRGLKTPECMESIDVSVIPNLIRNELSLSQKSFKLVSKSLVDRTIIEKNKTLFDILYTAANLPFIELSRHQQNPETGAYIHASKHWEYLYGSKALNDHFGDLKGLKIADVGAGRGAQVFGLARQGAKVDVFDMDYLWDHQGDLTLEDRFLKAANRVANIEFGSIFNIPGDTGTYDAVLCTSVIEHIIHKGPAIDELLRLLKIGGMLVLTFDLVDDLEKFNHLLGTVRTEIFDVKSLDHHIGTLCGEPNLFSPDDVRKSAIEAKRLFPDGTPEGMTFGAVAIVRTN